jgi:hypothetical protein
VNLLFLGWDARLHLMTEAVLHRRRDALNPASGSFSAGQAGFNCDLKLPAEPLIPRESWIRRAALAATSLASKKRQAVLASGAYHLLKGSVERLHLSKGGRIFCQTGRVWITIDGGSEDVILSSGEFRWFRPGTWLVMEAIAKADILLEA